MSWPIERIDSLTEKVIACAIIVHQTLGPGLLESVYRDALLIELREANFQAVRERRVEIKYRGQPIGNGLKIDLIIEGALIIEVKAIEHLQPVHLAQLITYLKLTGCCAGLLMNFNATTLKAGLRRAVHPDLYIKK